jgi:hypothetical protein
MELVERSAPNPPVAMELVERSKAFGVKAILGTDEQRAAPTTQNHCALFVGNFRGSLEMYDAKSSMSTRARSF